MQKERSKQNKKEKKRPFRYFLFDFVKVTGALPTLLWFRPKYIYQSKAAKRKVKKGGALFVANHTGFTDPVVMHCAVWYRRLHFVATKNLFCTKMKNWFFTHMLCISIDKENFGVSSFKEIVRKLQTGHAVGIFPEGGINADEHIVKAFKSGAVMMALQANAPIVPMYIVKREKWYRRTRVVIGEAVAVEREKMTTLKDIETFSQRLHDIEVELQTVYEERRKRK